MIMSEKYGTIDKDYAIPKDPTGTCEKVWNVFAKKYYFQKE